MMVMRWTARRKIETLQALDEGRVTKTELLDRWGMSEEEISEWRRLFAMAGRAGLRTTQLQIYREPRQRRITLPRRLLRPRHPE